MTTAVAGLPAAMPHMSSPVERNPSPRLYAAIAPSTSVPVAATPVTKPVNQNVSPPVNETSTQRQSGDGKTSPNSLRSGAAPKITVKKEPLSPLLRHRPQRLDLSRSTSNNHPSMAGRPSAPLPSKESAGLAMQDVGIACLSPGFQTHDPGMQQQLQKSLELREQQKRIIEGRLHKDAKGYDNSAEAPRLPDPSSLGTKVPLTSKRRGPPPGLIIAPPSHKQFTNERVIQSAPLNQSFTGLRQPPLLRHLVSQPSNLSQTSHIHHVPATQTNNRLPPISDVFASEGLSAPRSAYPTHSPGISSHSNFPPPLPSPGFPPISATQPPPSARPREYKSAEEAVRSMSGGRDDLLPRVVHYGGHQPPTPPSPVPQSSQLHPATDGHSHPAHTYGIRSVSGSGRRRTRDEYEQDMGSPSLRQEVRTGPFGEGHDSPETQRAKKEEFLSLCARAWDLFHS